MADDTSENTRLSSRSLTKIVMLTVLFFLGVAVIVAVPQSADLRSAWLAGAFFADGDPTTLYRGSDGAFSMQPPAVWVDAVRATGDQTPVYPFIYPPLWAWVMSYVTTITDFAGLVAFMGALNPALVFVSIALAWRISGGEVTMTTYLFIGVLFSLTSLVVLLPLEENQPQIIVAFLTLLGIERARHGAPVLGGIAMALAASIKLYPVVFALFWWAAGERRATAAFAIAGGALGLLSIAVAGWPMHAAFLHEVSAISRTALLSLGNFSLDPLIAAVTIPESGMQRVSTEDTGGQTLWFYVEKGPVWRAASAVVQLVTLLSLVWWARVSRLGDPLIWPVAMFLVAWVSPLSWLYHYMAALMFLPALAGRMPLPRAVLIIVLVALPSSYVLAVSGLTATVPPWMMVVANNAALLLAALSFALVLRAGARDP